MNTILYIRGLPGSGKTTLAKTLTDLIDGGVRPEMRVTVEVSTNDWFDRFNDGVWDGRLMRQAHTWCQNVVEEACRANDALVIVHNTGTQRWEIDPYRALAESFGYRLTVVTAEGAYGSVHNVPPEKIEQMRVRWEPWE